MNKTKTQSGITLVGLIITIIVLLILAIVSIRAIQQGGIIGKAQTATNEHQIAEEKEKISLAYGSYQIDKASGVSNPTLTVEGATVTPDATGWKVKFDKTGNEYHLNADGSMTGPKGSSGGSNPSETVDDDLETYILGKERTGRALVGDETNPGILDSSFIFQPDPENAKSSVYTKVKISLGEGNTAYIRYNRDVYQFNIDNDLKTVAGSLHCISTADELGNLGKYVTYQGNTWIVLRDDAGKVELISANALGSVTLGGSTFDAARDSYNSAIDTLTQACKDVTGITENIRNAGGLASDTTTATVTFRGLTGEDGTAFSPNEGVSFDQYEGANGLKIGDNNYTSDYEQMKRIGIVATDTPNGYWLASRFVDVSSNSVYFALRYVGSAGGLDDRYLCNVYRGGNSLRYSVTYAVRPVVSLSSGILNAATNAGTADDPIVIN